MIQQITDLDAVREVKRIHDDPEEHAVAVDGQMNYRDPSMKLATGNFTLPSSVLDLVNDDPDWQISKMQFRTAGEYEGCFTFRIERLN